MSYSIINLDEKEEWHQILNQFPSYLSDIYYTPEYYSIFKNYVGGKTRCFIYKDNSDYAIYPFYKNRIKKSDSNLEKDYFDIEGAYGYNGVLSSTNELKFRKSFYKTFYQFCKDQNIIADFTRYNPVLKNHKFAEGIVEYELNRKTVLVDLSKKYEDIYYNDFSVKNRNMITKAGKTLYAESGNTIGFYKIFISMYTYTMKRIDADKFYHFDFSFFKKLKNKFSKSSRVFIAYDKATSEAFGSIIILYDNHKGHYFLSARSKICNNNSVNNFLIDEAIKYLKAKNISCFHLGGGNSLDKNDSLLQFKKKFSNNLLNFYISKKIIIPEVYYYMCELWKKNNPSKIKKYDKYFLKYRF